MAAATSEASKIDTTPAVASTTNAANARPTQRAPVEITGTAWLSGAITRKSCMALCAVRRSLPASRTSVSPACSSTSPSLPSTVVPARWMAMAAAR